MSLVSYLVFSPSLPTVISQGGLLQAQAPHYLMLCVVKIGAGDFWELNPAFLVSDRIAYVCGAFADHGAGACCLKDTCTAQLVRLRG